MLGRYVVPAHPVTIRKPGKEPKEIMAGDTITDWRVVANRKGAGLIATDDVCAVTCRWKLTDKGYVVSRALVYPDDVVAVWQPEAITLWPGPNHWELCLDDPTTAAILLRVAMEHTERLCAAPGACEEDWQWWEWGVDGGYERWDSDPDLGTAAAQALLATWRNDP